LISLFQANDHRLLSPARCGRDVMRIAFPCSTNDQQMCTTRAPGKMRLGRSGFGNKAIARYRPRSTVIAIFAQHSTLPGSSTMILTSNDCRRAAPRSAGDWYEAS